MCDIYNYNFVFSFINNYNAYIYDIGTKTDFTVSNRFLKKIIFFILREISKNKYLLNINNILYIKKYNLFKFLFLSKIYKEHIFIKKYNILNTNNNKFKIYNYNHFNFKNSVILKMYFPKSIDNYEIIMRNISVHIAAFNPIFININFKRKLYKDNNNYFLFKNKILLYQNFLRNLNMKICNYLYNMSKYIKIIEYKNYIV
ncbi:MAG: hypothetical protein ABNO82_00090 [Candidatus Shikimatogenerans sp. Tder]|uniref:Translation elongation factor EFTs/EF1B dimerisation domain-containing protein n=1 Tax=Candidatus Shikimatogenerans sp. Tder TaxID=3158566 RepID=A0AAU7QT60_9FLAO